MNVSQLIEQLSMYNPTMEVRVWAQDGDLAAYLPIEIIETYKDYLVIEAY